MYDTQVDCFGLTAECWAGDDLVCAPRDKWSRGE